MGEERTLEEWRKDLRERLLIDTLLGINDEMIFEAEFDGYGDSGTVNAHTGKEEVDRFLEAMVEANATFDWYNNEGGGGDITWDVREDRITINGYYNEIQRVDVMNEVEL